MLQCFFGMECAKISLGKIEFEVSVGHLDGDVSCLYGSGAQKRLDWEDIIEKW